MSADFDFGSELCRALGIEPHGTYRIEIIVEAGGPGLVIARLFGRDERGQYIVVGEKEQAHIATLVKTWREQVGEPVVERES